MSNDSYYVVPGYQAMLTMVELKELQDISSHLLKYYVEENEVSQWEATAVPEVAELYSGSRACIELLQHLMQKDPPPEFKEKITGGGVCVTKEEYLGLASLLETMKALKKGVRDNYNISFEIH